MWYIPAGQCLADSLAKVIVKVQEGLLVWQVLREWQRPVLSRKAAELTWGRRSESLEGTRATGP